VVSASTWVAPAFLPSQSPRKPDKYSPIQPQTTTSRAFNQGRCNRRYATDPGRPGPVGLWISAHTDLGGTGPFEGCSPNKPDKSRPIRWARRFR
jgi:hypothetical protein